MKLRQASGNWARSLDDILDEDDILGLLQDVTPKKTQKKSSNDPAITNFLELVNFVETHGREPSRANPQEKLLAVRLGSYRSRADLQRKVMQYDTVGLLLGGELSIQEEKQKSEVTPRVTKKIVSSMEDIFEDDDLDLLDDISTSIFNVVHVSNTTKNRELPDEIASRKQCEDFFRYEKLFQDVQNLLKTDAVIQRRFSKEETITIGNMFILRGILCYIDKIIKEDTSNSERDNPRLRVIFENGTETDLLKRSLIRALFKDPHGKYIDMDPNLFSSQRVSISHKDRPTGYIYILASESNNPALSKWKCSGRLVKIGYSTQSVQTRIRYAEKSSTYLEAPVKLLAEITCYNLNPQKFEHLIHAFLHHQRLSLTLISSNGSTYHPEEWFTVDCQTALDVCKCIIDGTITNYRMDNTTGKMIKK